MTAAGAARATTSRPFQSGGGGGSKHTQSASAVVPFASSNAKANLPGALRSQWDSQPRAKPAVPFQSSRDTSSSPTRASSGPRDLTATSDHGDAGAMERTTGGRAAEESQGKRSRSLNSEALPVGPSGDSSTNTRNANRVLHAPEPGSGQGSDLAGPGGDNPTVAWGSVASSSRQAGASASPFARRRPTPLDTGRPADVPPRTEDKDSTANDGLDCADDTSENGAGGLLGTMAPAMQGSAVAVVSVGASDDSEEHEDDDASEGCCGNCAAMCGRVVPVVAWLAAFLREYDAVSDFSTMALLDPTTAAGVLYGVLSCLGLLLMLLQFPL